MNEEISGWLFLVIGLCSLIYVVKLLGSSNRFKKDK